MSLWSLGMVLKVLTYVLSPQKYRLRLTNRRIHLCRIGFQHKYQIFSDRELSKHVGCVRRIVKLDHRLCPVAKWAGRLS